MSDYCARCNGAVEVVTQDVPEGTVFICVQCGRQTDFVWNEDLYAEEIYDEDEL